MVYVINPDVVGFAESGLFLLSSYGVVMVGITSGSRLFYLEFEISSLLTLRLETDNTFLYLVFFMCEIERPAVPPPPDLVQRSNERMWME